MSQNKKKYTSTKRRSRSKVSTPLLLMLGGLLVLAAAVALIGRDSSRGGTGEGATGDNVPVEVSGAPSLKVDKEQVDLGDVKLGQTVQVSFQVANAGDEPLQLTKAPYVEVVEGC